MLLPRPRGIHNVDSIVTMECASLTTGCVITLLTVRMVKMRDVFPPLLKGNGLLDQVRVFSLDISIYKLLSRSASY